MGNRPRRNCGPDKELTLWIAAILALLVVHHLCTGLVMADTGEISSIYVAPDLTYVIVGSEGPLGKHSAFVIDRPSCIIVDFESTDVGKVKSTIRVNRPPISEIRTGYNNGKARVIVDFGETPVPQFQVQRDDNLLVVAFGKFQYMSRDKLPKEQMTTAPTGRLTRTPLGNQPLGRPVVTTLEKPLLTHAAADPAEMSQAGTNSLYFSGPETAAHSRAFERTVTKNNSVMANILIRWPELEQNVPFLELAHPREGRTSYRLSIDRDFEKLRVGEAKIRGTGLKANTLLLYKSTVAYVEENRPIRVATESYEPLSRQPALAQSKLRIVSSAQIAGEKSKVSASRGWPLRIEEFRLKARFDR